MPLSLFTLASNILFIHTWAGINTFSLIEKGLHPTYHLHVRNLLTRLYLDEKKKLAAEFTCDFSDLQIQNYKDKITYFKILMQILLYF